MTWSLESLRPTEKSFVEAWQAANGRVLNGSNPNLAAARISAIERFAAIGLPLEKEEAWKYTNIRRLLDAWAGSDPLAASTLPDQDTVADASMTGRDAVRLVLVNGRFEPLLSTLDQLPAGLTISSLGDAAASSPELFAKSFGKARPDGSDGLVALNSAFAQGGLFLRVAKGRMIETPIELVHLATATSKAFVQPRTLCVVEAGAAVRLVETYRSRAGGPVFTNAVVEVIVDRDAHVDHVRVVDESIDSVHVHYLQVRQLASSVFSTASFVLGGGTVRSDAYILPDAEFCETHLNGFYYAAGTTHVDNHTMVDHAKPNCESNELYKGILDGHATGVFNGKVLVRQDAQKTNAYQKNKSVVLSATARMFSKPELEIYADDVKCSHGATTGKLDDDAFFYLRSRGIPPARARLLLLQAFAGDVFELVKDEVLRDRLAVRLEELLYA